MRVAATEPGGIKKSEEKTAALVGAAANEKKCFI